jgi:catechol 2,3-dioxygenase-like lactoylglutathione lyase family enzyme
MGARLAGMRFHGISLLTRDLPRLRAFYCEVLQAEAEGDDGFCFVLTGGASLSLFAAEWMEAMVPDALAGAGTGSFTIEVEVADVDAEAARLAALNVPVVKPPTTQPWGRRSMWIRDPDGNIVNLFAPVTPENA